jgi:hypothetical protein
MDTAQKTKAVRQVKQHRAALAWWLAQAQAHPLGIVPIPTAARMLGVTPNRVHGLIQEGRLRVVDGMPGGNPRDRFVPVLDLVDAPFNMTRGRPGVWGPEKRFSQDFLDRAPTTRKRKSRKDLP